MPSSKPPSAECRRSVSSPQSFGFNFGGGGSEASGPEVQPLDSCRAGSQPTRMGVVRHAPDPDAAGQQFTVT